METPNSYCYRHRRMRKIVFGLLVMTAGVLLLGFNMGYLPASYKHIIFSWQMLLIAIGLMNLAARESWGFGIILMAVGTFFILPVICAFSFDFVSLFWPILLIFAGIMILVKRGFRHHHHHFRHMRHVHHFTHWHHDKEEQATFEDGYIHDEYIFSGSKRKFTGKEFKGGRISIVFGGAELDLTQTTLAEGKNELAIDCVFGGVNLIIPSDWIVHLNVNTVMGGFVDKRTFIKNSDENAENRRELIIKGSAVFGGGEIKSY